MEGLRTGFHRLLRGDRSVWTEGSSGQCELAAQRLLLAIFIPWKWRYSYTSLLCSILFTIAGYYTKAYYLLAAPIMGSYLFFFISFFQSIFCYSPDIFPATKLTFRQFQAEDILAFQNLRKTSQ